MPGLSFKPGEKIPRDFSVPSLAQRAVTLVLPATNFAWVQVPTKCPRVQEPRAVVTQTELCPIRPLIKKFLTIRKFALRSSIISFSKYVRITIIFFSVSSCAWLSADSDCVTKSTAERTAAANCVARDTSPDLIKEFSSLSSPDVRLVTTSTRSFGSILGSET